jgi:phospholipase/carboxylesterase
VPAATDLFSRTWHDSADSPHVVLLHGSGQDENTLLAFTRTACPGSTITALRGRIPWEEGYAFFRRGPDRTLDEADLTDGAAAVQRLLGRLQQAGHRPPLLLGYSNGAIAAAGAVIGDRQLSAGAILLRPLSPFPARSFPRLDGYPVLLVSGDADSRRDLDDGPSLAKQFKSAGAAADLITLPSGHDLTTADEDAVSAWLLDLCGPASAP